MSLAQWFKCGGLAFLLCFIITPIASAIELHGSFKQGAMIRGKLEADSHVRAIIFEGQSLKISPAGDFVFGMPYDQGPNINLTLIDADDKHQTLTYNVAAQTYNIEHVDGLPQKTIDIPKEELERRQHERTLVAEARAPKSDALFWRDQFILPAKGRLSGFYGSQRILNGKPMSPHFGLDVAAPVGTEIIAPAGGVVTLAQSNFLLEGGIVIIDHGFSIFSTLFHMNSVNVQVGQRVEQGDVIGTVGQKGRASGPHVDWRVNWGSVRLDPKLLVTLKP